MYVCLRERGSNPAGKYKEKISNYLRLFNRCISLSFFLPPFSSPSLYFVFLSPLFSSLVYVLPPTPTRILIFPSPSLVHLFSPPLSLTFCFLIPLPLTTFCIVFFSFFVFFCLLLPSISLVYSPQPGPCFSLIFSASFWPLCSFFTLSNTHTQLLSLCFFHAVARITFLIVFLVFNFPLLCHITTPLLLPFSLSLSPSSSAPLPFPPSHCYSMFAGKRICLLEIAVN